MATYNPNNTRDYLAILDFVEKAKRFKFKIELAKHYEKATDKQRKYLEFMLSYFSYKYGQSFFATLHLLQTEICPNIFQTGDVDHQGKPIYKKLCYLNTAEVSSCIRGFQDFANMQGVLIPEQEDEQSMAYCLRELEQSGAGWGV